MKRNASEKEKLTVLRPSPGLHRECAGAQAKKPTQLPAEFVYVQVDTTKFNELQLISGNGRRQLAIGLRLASRYPIQVDAAEVPGVRKGSSTGFARVARFVRLAGFARFARFVRLAGFARFVRFAGFARFARSVASLASLASPASVIS